MDAKIMPSSALASAILAGSKPADQSGPADGSATDGETDNDVGYQTAADSAMKALSAKDPKGFASALKSMIDMVMSAQETDSGE